MKNKLRILLTVLALASFTLPALAQAAPTPTVRTTSITSPAGVTTTTTSYSFIGVTSANLAATITAAQSESPAGESFQNLNVQKSGTTYQVFAFYR